MHASRSRTGAAALALALIAGAFTARMARPIHRAAAPSCPAPLANDDTWDDVGPALAPVPTSRGGPRLASDALFRLPGDPSPAASPSTIARTLARSTVLVPPHQTPRGSFLLDSERGWMRCPGRTSADFQPVPDSEVPEDLRLHYGDGPLRRGRS